MLNCPGSRQTRAGGGGRFEVELVVVVAIRNACKNERSPRADPPTRHRSPHLDELRARLANIRAQTTRLPPRSRARTELPARRQSGAPPR